MRVIAKGTLREFWQQPEYADSEGALKAWCSEAINAKWENPADVKQHYASARLLKGGRLVFNIAGNKDRLVVLINYAAKIVFIRFIGTHKQYDEIDAEVI